MARECANLLIGGTGPDRSLEAWRQVYRSLEHGSAKDRCRDSNMIRKFPKGIEDFANTFVTMQAKRHDADYAPYVKFDKSSVASDIVLVEQAINDFKSSKTKDRRAFCAYVLLKKRS
ncbi:MAG: hypothetical protein ACREFO_05130 [Acetobacteraceae bacterium]